MSGVRHDPVLVWGTMKGVIEVHELVKRYKKAEKSVVDGISFDVRAGEFFALLGPNGAGKTTTISIFIGVGPTLFVRAEQNR